MRMTLRPFVPLPRRTATSSAWLRPATPKRSSLSRGRRTSAGSSRSLFWLRAGSPAGGASAGYAVPAVGAVGSSGIASRLSKGRAAPAAPRGVGSGRPRRVRGRTVSAVGSKGRPAGRVGSGSAAAGSQDPTPGDAQAPGEELGDGAAVDAVLRLEDPRRETLGRVVIQDRHGLLQDDRSGVDTLVGEMDGAAADLHACLDRLALRFPAGERRQERGMDVEDPALGPL